ncbi:MAG: type II toxin-antitoxin system RelE/ParE family toxin [Hyphomicrobium sp.]|nr:type II toxin-antitoxin system RelE/ParE family toxin [Hyphomicrobium sp.]
MKKPLKRAFKTAWFSKAARKARIGDPALIAAIREVMQGKADDLGGGVFKKRLNKNMHRSIVLAKGGRHWIFAYLFAKKDRANIDDDELADFKKLAQAYGRMTNTELRAALNQGDLLELCDEE